MITGSDWKPGRRGSGMLGVAVGASLSARARARCGAGKPAGHHRTRRRLTGHAAGRARRCAPRARRWNGQARRRPRPGSGIRCDADLDEDSCRAIAGATTTSYTAVATNAASAWWCGSTPRTSGMAATTRTRQAASSPRPRLRPRRTRPRRPPRPRPRRRRHRPTPTPPADPGPASRRQAAPLQPTVPVPQGAVLPAAAAKPPTMMRPAPVIRIRGRLLPLGRPHHAAHGARAARRADHGALPRAAAARRAAGRAPSP